MRAKIRPFALSASMRKTTVRVHIAVKKGAFDQDFVPSMTLWNKSEFKRYQNEEEYLQNNRPYSTEIIVLEYLV